MNLGTPKAGAKHELLFNKPASTRLQKNEQEFFLQFEIRLELPR